MNKALKIGLIASSTLLGLFVLYREYKKEQKKVEEEMKSSDEQSRQIGIINPELESYIDDGIDEKNVVLKTLSKITRNLGDKDDEKSIWTTDILTTLYYLDPVNDYWTYNFGVIHVIQNFEIDNTVTLMIQLPPYEKPEEYSIKSTYTPGDYIRTIKSSIKDFSESISYPRRLDFDICGYYEKINPNSKDVDYIKIPSLDYKSYDERGDGLSRYVSMFYANDRAMLKKSQYSAVNMYIKVTFQMMNDGMDDIRLMGLLKNLLFDMKIKQKNNDDWKKENDSEEEDENYTELAGVIFHRERLEWFYEFDEKSGKINEFTFNVD